MDSIRNDLGILKNYAIDKNFPINNKSKFYELKKNDFVYSF